MIEIKTLSGIPVQVPEIDAEDDVPKFELSEIDEIVSYYDKFGFVVVRSLIDESVCDSLRDSWETEIKVSKSKIYRQANGKLQSNIFNSSGFIMNAVLNPHSVNPKEFVSFRENAEKILTNKVLNDIFCTFFGESSKIVQSLYFEGNSVTEEHQDAYYLDSTNIGEMAAAWIALEDINADAGRFYVAPGSHKVLLDRQDSRDSISENLDAYVAKVVAHVAENQLEIKAPKLNMGDVLFWNSLTIHGSLASESKTKSRSSLTCHAIPKARDLLVFQKIAREVAVENVKNVWIARPKDQNLFKNRLIYFFESNFPVLFYWLKQKTILWLLK
jgi:phytanoyl-CoA hydroxylase